MKEECGLIILRENLEKIGRLDFTFESSEKLLDVHIFKASTYEGELMESDGKRWKNKENQKINLSF